MGNIDAWLIALIITALFEVLALHIANLFILTEVGENKDTIIDLTMTSIRIASIGYAFNGF